MYLLYLPSEAMRPFLLVILPISLVVLACGSGYWLARSTPVRFTGEKVLIGLLTGAFAATLTYILNKSIGNTVHPSQIIVALSWFFLYGLSGEITAQIKARRRQSDAMR